MPPRVQRLVGPIVDQIAAGEVVERPASVVKELLENCIDAGATSISVDIEDGGRGRIRIADDGHGMDRDDACLAIERHATSKLRTVEDLASIRTLGFRGEALPSIASVSSLTLTTRPRANATGTEILVRGGELVHVHDAGGAPGTVIDVQQLFYNVPARLKFLKSKATEAGAIYDVVLRVALAHPELRLSVTHDGRKVHSYLPVRDRAERASMVFVDDPLTLVEGENEHVKAYAMLSAPERARTGARWLHVFVNGRPVHDVKLARAVAFAFGSVLPPGRYPSGVVHLAVPHDEVDVNAHPQKFEVRFARGATFFESVTRALSRELGTRAFGGPAGREAGYWNTRLGGRIVDEATKREPADFRPAIAASTRGGGGGGGGAHADAFVRALAARPADETSRPADESSRSTHEAASRAEHDSSDLGAMRAAGPLPVRYPVVSSTDASVSERMVDRLPSSSVASSPNASDARATLHGTARGGAYGSLRFIGQVKKTFLVCEGNDGLVVLDQHAVDERILYHRIRTSLVAERVEVQRLLFPERVELSHEEAELAERRADDLSRAGLECTRIGPTTLAIHTVPLLLARARPATLALDLVTELFREGDRAFGDALDTAFATMACHAAIRAGDVLSPVECQALLRALDEVDAFAGHCPHGRPVVTTVAFDELEKKLGR